MQLRRLGVIIAVVVSAASFAGPLSSSSFAQDSDVEPTQVEASPKGKIGLGLIGAEIGVAIPALIGVDAAWPYIVFPIVGAAGGAVLGHFVLDDPNHAGVSVAVMTAGMALVIPTLVLAIAATEYDPEDDVSTTASLGTGAVRIDDHGQLSLAAPGVAVLPNPVSRKLEVSGVNVSVLSGRF